MKRQRINGLWRSATGFIMAAGLTFCLACAGTSGPSMQQVADVQSANRSATELGAQKNPRAELHLKLAEEQLQQAKQAISNDEDERANGLLMRAKADAELAIALTREDNANTQASTAAKQAGSKSSTDGQMGATP